MNRFVFLSIVVAFCSSFANAVREYPPNQDISPCKNFYQFVCSKEIANFKMPANRSRYTFYSADIYENFLSLTSTFLKELSLEKNPQGRGKLVRDFYQSCVNKPARIAEENRLSKRVLADMERLKSRSEILQYAIRTKKAGELTWLPVEDYALLSDPTKWRLTLEADVVTMKKKAFYENGPAVEHLKTVARSLFETLKMNSPGDRAERVVGLEKRIANSMLSVDQESIGWDIKENWSRAEFTHMYPLLAQQLRVSEWPGDIPIHRYSPGLYESLENILREEDPQTLKDFLVFSLLREKMDFSVPKWKDEYVEFEYKQLGKPQKRRALDLECAQLAQNEMGRIFASVMIEKYFKDYPRKEFTQFVESIRSGLLKRIEANQWLEEESRQRVISKVKAIRMGLLFPEKEQDWRFPRVKSLSPTRFLENRANLVRGSDARVLEEIVGPRNLEAWGENPLFFDVTYSRYENRFYFPAAYAMKPMYDPARREIENLGAIGMLVGHEMGHALDRSGAEFNEMGVKDSILSDQDKKHFEQLSVAFVEHFDQTGHDGKQTLAENMADFVGLNAAYGAAFPSGSDDREQQKLFFTSFGRRWCTAMTDGYRDSHLKADPHALPEARVNEQLKQMPEFADAFQCSANSEMVAPENRRLRLW